MKKLIVVSALFLSAFAGYAQKSKALYVEAGGIGLPFSFSYDTRFKTNTNTGAGLRVGVGGFAIDNEKMFTLPVQLNWVLGKQRNFVEFGIGATYVYYEGYDYYEQYNCDQFGCTPTGKRYAGDFILPISNQNSVMGTVSMGYRRVPEGSGFTWRAAITPVFNENGFWPLFAGIGVGYKF